MALERGALLGDYEALEPLGAGGMGEVWLARDQHLHRKVALKVLPLDLNLDEARVARFQQEARLASSLNHPNVCTIHALGVLSDGRRYIAMEFIEGRTLRSLLAQRRPGCHEAIGLAIQVASALTAAHAGGVVHRDIKPENVMVRPDGVVKVLDFGLAKLDPLGAARPAEPTRDAGRDPSRDGDGHSRLHVARAGSRTTRGCADGHLVTGRCAVRDGGRTRSIRGSKQHRHSGGDSRS